MRHGQYQRRRTQSDGHLTEIGEKQATYAANFLSSQLPENVLFDSLTHSDSETVVPLIFSQKMPLSSL